MRGIRIALGASLAGGALLAASGCHNNNPVAPVDNGGGGTGEVTWPFNTPFDFTDEFYLENGLDPAGFASRLTPESPQATYGVSQDPTRNNTRILGALGGYDAAGMLLYYPTPPAPLTDAAFLPNGAGTRALALANQYRAFLFPQQSVDPLSSVASERRQGNVFDTSSGYFHENPLGLWRVTFVHYTDDALNTADGQAKLQELADRNGLDRDGTPILKRLSEILELEDLGYVDLLVRPDGGSSGPPWVV